MDPIPTPIGHSGSHISTTILNLTSIFYIYKLLIFYIYLHCVILLAIYLDVNIFAVFMKMSL